MAVITNYATLLTAIADYLARDDLTSYIPNFVQNVENKLYRTLNLRNEETALSVSISSGVATVPSDFKALKLAYFNESPVQLLKWVSINELYSDYPTRSTTGTPLVITREGASFVFGPASKDGTLKGIYYAKQGFARDLDTTWYVTEAPDVLLYGALLESAPFIGADERIAVWRDLYTEAVATLRTEQMEAEHSKGPLMQRVS